jgi:multidrug efflux system membrane fusion protein
MRLVDPGNVVQADGTTPLVIITQLQPITVGFTVEKTAWRKCKTKRGTERPYR